MADPVSERGRTKEQAKSTLKLAEKRGRLKQLAVKRDGGSGHESHGRNTDEKPPPEGEG